MTKRQIRELTYLVVAVCAGALLGFGYRSWMQKTQGSTTKGGVNLAHPPMTQESRANAPNPLSDTAVVARFDGNAIKGAQINKYVGFYLGISGKTEAEATREELLYFRRLALNEIIEEPILDAEAKRKGVSVSEAELETFLKKAKEGFGSEADFEKAVSEDLGLSIDEFMSFSKRMLLRQKLIEATPLSKQITDAEVEKALKNLKQMMKSHPGGEVPLPSPEEMRKKLELNQKQFAFEAWLAEQRKKYKVEILDESLNAPPLDTLSDSENPHDFVTAKPVPH